MSDDVKAAAKRLIQHTGIILTEDQAARFGPYSLSDVDAVARYALDMETRLSQLLDTVRTLGEQRDAAAERAQVAQQREATLRKALDRLVDEHGQRWIPLLDTLGQLRHSRDCRRSTLPANYDRGGEVMRMGACDCERDNIVRRIVKAVSEQRGAIITEIVDSAFQEDAACSHTTDPRQTQAVCRACQQEDAADAHE